MPPSPPPPPTTGAASPRPRARDRVRPARPGRTSRAVCWYSREAPTLPRDADEQVPAPDQRAVGPGVISPAGRVGGRGGAATAQAHREFARVVHRFYARRPVSGREVTMVSDL